MICVSVEEPTLELIFKAIENEELAEIRLDLIDLLEKEIETLFYQNIKLIATCRPGKYSDSQRKAILKKSIEAGAAFVDIELEASDDFKTEIVTLAKKKKCKVIISYHNYDNTPPKGELDQVIDWCFNSGADIAKIVCKVNHISDNARLLSLYEQDKEIIAFGMGEKAKFTRIAAPFLGAPFTYASVSTGKETADGQIDKTTLAKLLEILENV